MQEKNRLITIRAMVLGCLFLGDRLLKSIIWFSVPKDADFFLIHPLLNTSISFSLPLPENIHALLLPVLIVIVLVLVVVSVRGAIKGDLLFFWWGCIAVGAVSNILDRIQLGGVLDYISIWIFPVFNVSDVYITIGAGMIILNELFKKKKIITH